MQVCKSEYHKFFKSKIFTKRLVTRAYSFIIKFMHDIMSYIWGNKSSIPFRR